MRFTSAFLALSIGIDLYFGDERIIKPAILPGVFYLTRSSLINPLRG